MTDLLRVVKVGGSLFDWPQLPSALADWLDRQSPRAATTALVAGGGALVDVIHAAHRRFGWDDETAHWMSIRAMEVTAHMLAAMLPEARLISDLRALRQPSEGLLREQRFVCACLEFMERDEPGLPGEAVPHDWRATSDSIAARVATAVEADELVLLKSTNVPDRCSLLEAASNGWVDEWFPAAAERLAQVRWVNLRTGEELWLLRS